jgi:MFS family permease
MRIGEEHLTSSTWAALANPVFRKLWIAAVISGTLVAAHDTAATWLMNTLTPSPFLISLLSTMASLPFFLFTLPSGALADMVDRKKLLYLANLWLAAAAAGLAILGWLHLINPYVILTFVFLIGLGFALNAPTWTSTVSEVVPNAELPSAATLGSLQLNMSGIIGPTLGGLLVAWIGPNFVFVLNATCFLVVILAVLQWKRTIGQPRTGLESFFGSFVTAIRYVHYAPGLQIVLARNALFALFISVIPALMPVVGLKVPHLDTSQLGLLFTSMGAGSVVGAAVFIPWLRERCSSNTLVVIANLLVVLVYLLMAVVRQKELFMVVAALAGVGWTLSASELWVAAQRAMPGWARGRMNGTLIMVSQGALAIGGVIWGSAVATAGTSWRLHEHLIRPNAFRLEIGVPSWNEHLLQKERVTQAERDVLERVWSRHRGDTPPEEQIYLAVNGELLTPRQCDCQEPSAHKGSRDVQSQEIGSNKL